MKKLITNLEKLRTPSEPIKFMTDKGIEKDEILEISKELKDWLEKHPKELYIAAPQLGIYKQIFCIRFNDVVKTFVDPVIKKKKKLTVLPETFTNMPGKEILISRPDEVEVVYWTDEFKYEDNKLLGYAARIFDQLVQLFAGALPSDTGLVSDIEEDGCWKDATEEELKQAQDYYINVFAPKLAEIQIAKIKENPDLEAEYRKLRFAEDVMAGNSAVVENTGNLNRAQRRQLAKNKNK